MRIVSVVRLAFAAVLLLASSAAAADQGAVALAQFLKPLLILPADSAASWEGIEAAPAIKWGQGPVEHSRASPDGNFYARPGQATLSGRALSVVASGARTMVFSVYLRDPTPPMAPEALVAGLREAGFTVTPARCPVDPSGAAPKRWHRLALAGKKPAFLYAGPLQSGGSGYTLYLDQLPAMTQSEAGLYTDDCRAAGKAAAGGGAAARPTTGQAGIVAVIGALLRPVGAPASLPWASLATLPAITWPKLTPTKMTNPWTDGGLDPNPQLLEGEFKTATTRMTVIATGDARAANHVSLIDGANLPRGAVFDGLIRGGYAITALRCGKPYTEMTDSFYRIAGPGKQAAILYRRVSMGGGKSSESYGLRLDNVLPPIVQGQSAPVGGRCPG
jgi:hypothetical protein